MSIRLLTPISRSRPTRSSHGGAGVGGKDRGCGYGEPGQPPADPLGAVGVQDATLADSLLGRRAQLSPSVISRLGLGQLLGCQHVQPLLERGPVVGKQRRDGLVDRLAAGGLVVGEPG